ncbi:MAG: PAS domain S-box protein [Rhodobacteraceae bacterium]|nr:PAS domain S-box protein [Paracoccaceae bacterium]
MGRKISAQSLYQMVIWATIILGMVLSIGTILHQPMGLKGLRTITPAFSLDQIIVYGLLISVLVLALNRRNQIMKLQSRLLEQQAREYGLQERAMNAHAIVSITDPNGKIISVNDNFVTAMGYDRADLIDQSINMIYWNGPDDAIFNAAHARSKSGAVWSGENILRRSDNAKLIMQCTIVPLHDKQGRHVKNMTIRTDITESRKAEADRSLKVLLDNLHDEVYIYDADSLDMRYANFSAMARCEWTRESLPAKNIADSDPSFNLKVFRAHVAPLFSGHAETVTFDVAQKKGQVEIKTRLYTDEKGERMFVSVLRDTTERKKLERAKLETVSVVSHELRTPLTSIKGALRLLKSGKVGPISDAAKTMLDIADRNSERLLLVVNDILDLEKIKAGKMKFDLAPADLVNFLRDAVAMNKGYGDEQNVSFAFETPLAKATANIESNRMMQVLSNLMSNAAKFSPDGGVVRISLEHKGKSWRIGVTDNGPGIPDEARGTIFESFTQLDNVDGIKRSGTGLGLTISNKIIRAHGGRIDYQSEIGKGTTFFVDLPAPAEDDQSGSSCPQGIAAE